MPTISKSTVASLLEAADLYSAHVLHQTCINFIVKNFQVGLNSWIQWVYLRTLPEGELISWMPARTDAKLALNIDRL